MPTSSAAVSPSAVAMARQASGACGRVVATLGLFVLAGWAWDIDELKRVRPSWAAMKANTAICLVLLGAALWLFDEATRGARRAAILALSAIALAVGALTLTQDLFGWSLGIDEWL